jgi:polysaccharide pyruvyl transferase WcaK-like protein
MNRRQFIGGISATLAAAPAKRPQVVLLRSGWQTVNIGDIAHTPGVLAVIQRHMPDARVILWPAAVDRGVEPMLKRRFPKLEILPGTAADDGAMHKPEVLEAIKAADVFVHGSAASMSSQAQIQTWRKNTSKPYGFFGVGFTLQGEAAGTSASDSVRDNAKNAAFLFTRETASLANLKAAGIAGPKEAFAPDGTFSMDIVDEAKGIAFLQESGLGSSPFICLVPRLRYTPYQKFRKTNWSDAEIKRRTEANDKFAEADHAKLREVAAAWIHRTGGKVLLCPEMTYELDVIDPLLYDPLPAELKKNVVRRKTYWLPDEASSVYRRAAAVISCECHSPILAAVQGTPCIYVHQPEDGIKGQMWQDLGLGSWFFDIDATTGPAIAERVLDIHRQHNASKAKVRAAVQRAKKLQDDAMAYVKSVASQT